MAVRRLVTFHDKSIHPLFGRCGEGNGIFDFRLVGAGDAPQSCVCYKRIGRGKVAIDRRPPNVRESRHGADRYFTVLRQQVGCRLDQGLTGALFLIYSSR